MHLAPTGRIIFAAQWVFALFLPIFVFIGRGFVGAGVGWMAVFGILYGIVLIVLLIIPPVIALFDGPARRERTVRQAYAVATAVLWLALVVTGLTIPDAGDSGHLDSALSAWWGISYEESVIVFAVSVGVAIVAWIAASATAIAGVVRSRRAA